MFNFFLNNIKKKLSFNKLKKKKYLIIGIANSEIFKKLLGKKDTEIVCLTAFINFYLIILLILKIKKFNQINYYSEAIKLVDPIIIITSIDTNPNFYRLKKYFPKKKFISIQNGIRQPQSGNFKKVKNLECDIIFCNGLNDINYYKSRVSSEILPLGSLRNNFIANYKSTQINCLSYISQFRIKNENEDNINFLGDYSNITWKDYIESEKKLIILLNKFCKEKNMPFYIVGASYNSSIEKKWYLDLIKANKINFINRKKFDTSYKFLQKSKYIVCMDSTLGYEFFARGKKIIFFSRKIKKAKKLNNEMKFGWPFIKKTKGFFYSDKVTEEEINKLIKNISNCSNKKWLKKISIIKKQIMIYDYKNKILKKKISEFKL